METDSEVKLVELSGTENENMKDHIILKWIFMKLDLKA
jgi:hypothetical protein